MSKSLVTVAEDAEGPRERLAPLELADRVCATCGYGIAAPRTPPAACPMCGGCEWLSRPSAA